MPASLFEQHLRLMSGDGAVHDQEEAARVAAMKLPELRLDARRRDSTKLIVSALALAACLAFMLLRPERPGVVEKGGTRVNLIWRRGEATLPWHEGSEARDGDRFSAEVVADRPLAAFLGVYDRTGQLLSDPQQMLLNHLELAPGERAGFSSGFELTAADEGEEAAVFTCELATFKGAEPLPFVVRIASEGGCTIARFRLR
jgi:hypothetical protein